MRKMRCRIVNFDFDHIVMQPRYLNILPILFMLQIKLGTMEQDEAQTEWVIRPFMNTTKKRKFLGD